MYLGEFREHHVSIKETGRLKWHLIGPPKSHTRKPIKFRVRPTTTLDRHYFSRSCCVFSQILTVCLVFYKGSKNTSIQDVKSTGRPWSRPDLFKTETTSRQNSRCKVRQPAFLKNILPMDGQMICQECHHLHVLKFGHMYHSLAKTLIQILKTIHYRRAWRKRQHSSMMNTWKTPKRAVTVTIFTSNANAFTATERSTNHMIWDLRYVW